MAQRRQFFTDLSQASTFAGRRAGTSQPLALCHHFRPQLPVALAPFTLATFLALALAGVPQLVDETGLLVLSKGAGDLAHQVTIQPATETLTDQAIETITQKIVADVKRATGGELRT